MSIQFRETAPPMRGEFRMRVFRRGTLVEEYRDHNLIVNGARNVVAGHLSGECEGKHLSKIAFGVNGNIPIPDDTAITSPFVKPVLSVSLLDNFQLEFKWNLLASEANGKAIIEFGLLCEDGTLFARRARSAAIPKEPDISLEGEWIIIL